MSLHHMLRAAAGNSAGSSDPYFYDVTLLLTGDGTNGAQNNTFLDSSTNNFTITRNGNTTQGTFSPYGNLWSNYFDGSGDYLTVPDDVAFTIGSGDFTIEAWVYTTASATRQFITWNGSNAGGGSTASFGFEITASTTVIGRIFSGSTAYTASSSASVSLNTWNHVAFVRYGNTTTVYINGVADGTANVTGVTANDSTYPVKIASNSAASTGGYPFFGYISNLRIVKGTAVYTSNFTPSTTPLTAVSGTSLLTCQSNRFIDNSSNNFTLTVGGNTSVQRFSPFNPTEAYSAATIGGSGYFDGTGDYLNTPATGQFAPTGDFTAGVWYYPLALPAYTGLLGNYVSNNTTDWLFEIVADGTLNMYTNGASIRIQSAAGAIKIGQWNYVSMSRSGTTITGYLNGTSVGTYTQSGTFGSASKTIYIGSQAASYLVNGYLSDVKLIDGSAVTTVPTAPMTATSGTNLLLNFTNAGIPDAAMMNDLETVGNAQVSTSVKKYGTGSLAFDGTGDWLTAPDSVNLQLGTGDFTIEGWIYLSATGAARGFVSKGTSTTGWSIGVNSSNQLMFSYTATSLSGTTALSGTTWYHFAVVRNGNATGNLKIYLNGVADATSGSAVTDNFTQTSIMYVGANRTGASALNGYLDDVRITKGYARYTANFTPPTAALPTY